MICSDESIHRRAVTFFKESQAVDKSIKTGDLAKSCLSLGTERDESPAFELFKLGHQNGDLLATFELGNLLMYGLDVEHGVPRALVSIREAHMQGHPSAAFVLAGTYSFTMKSRPTLPFYMRWS